SERDRATDRAASVHIGFRYVSLNSERRRSRTANIHHAPALRAGRLILTPERRFLNGLDRHRPRRMPALLPPPPPPRDDTPAEAVAAFTRPWQRAQAAELANAQPFLIGLCPLLGAPAPDPATKDPAQDAYVFERPVLFQDGATTSTGRIDLYKRGCFVLETKQGVDAERRQRGRSRSGHGTRGSAAWERAIKAAKEQAARYARNLDQPGAPPEPLPPLVIACDVGYCFDLY